MKGIRYMYTVEVAGIADKLDTALNVFDDKNDVQSLLRARIKEDVIKAGYDAGRIDCQLWQTVCLECHHEIGNTMFVYCPFCATKL